jgi:hypothetical protein
MPWNSPRQPRHIRCLGYWNLVEVENLLDQGIVRLVALVLDEQCHYTEYKSSGIIKERFVLFKLSAALDSGCTSLVQRA